MLFPFSIILTILLSQGRLFKTIQVSKPLPLCACSCKLYSGILAFWSLYSSPFDFREKSNALPTKPSPTKAKASLSDFFNTSCVGSRSIYQLFCLIDKKSDYMV